MAYVLTCYGRKWTSEAIRGLGLDRRYFSSYAVLRWRGDATVERRLWRMLACSRHTVHLPTCHSKQHAQLCWTIAFRRLTNQLCKHSSPDRWRNLAMKPVWFFFFHQAVNMFISVVNLDILIWKSVGIDSLWSFKQTVDAVQFLVIFVLASFVRAGGCYLGFMTPQSPLALTLETHRSDPLHLPCPVGTAVYWRTCMKLGAYPHTGHTLDGSGRFSGPVPQTHAALFCLS